MVNAKIAVYIGGFKKAFDFSPFPMLITSVEDGRFIEVNESFLETFECNREDVICDTAQTLSFYSDPEQRRKLMQELLNNGYFKNVEVGFRTKSGNKGIGLLSARLINFYVKFKIPETQIEQVC